MPFERYLFLIPNSDELSLAFKRCLVDSLGFEAIWSCWELEKKAEFFLDILSGFISAILPSLGVEIQGNVVAEKQKAGGLPMPCGLIGISRTRFMICERWMLLPLSETCSFCTSAETCLRFTEAKNPSRSHSRAPQVGACFSAPTFTGRRSVKLLGLGTVQRPELSLVFLPLIPSKDCGQISDQRKGDPSPSSR